MLRCSRLTTNRVFGALASCLLSACAFEPEDRAPGPGSEADIAEDSMRIPVDFDAACRALADLPEPPPDLTMGEFFACLTPASRHALDQLYRKEAARRRGSPATLDELVALHGDVPVAAASLRELAFGSSEMPAGVMVPGVAPALVARARTLSKYGLDPTTCSGSCTSTWVDLVGGRRRIGYGAALRSPSLVKDDKSARYLDEIYPGSFPDFRQADLANSELRQAGCGPVSAVNLFEWWGIPIYSGTTALTSFDSRASYVARRMETLDGVNFTDDDDLIDFFTRYPREVRDAGYISGYPGYHYMRDNPEGFKVMMSYVARGFPVVALYSTSSDSLHWAAITGMKGGKLLIGNGTDREIADFYNRWEEWQSLDWYAEYGAGLFVETSTFIAYTGWNGGTPPPDRFSARTAKAYLPSYTTSRSTYLFRYCVGSSDEIGSEAETIHVGAWADEPSGRLPGYCMFMRRVDPVKLTPSPSGGSASSARGANLGLSVASTAGLTAFISGNPGAKCRWYGKEAGSWVKLADVRCNEAGALAYTFENQGQYSDVVFYAHAPELARTAWKITVR